MEGRVILKICPEIKTGDLGIIITIASNVEILQPTGMVMFFKGTITVKFNSVREHNGNLLTEAGIM
jgi:hypothetical protein